MDLDNIRQDWDLLVIGGGITGAGVFREAAGMGIRTLLCEAKDFAWGTSSRSSKLIHGGLRYLRQGRLSLTYDSVRQRERLLREAPGLVEPLGFLVPVYKMRGPGRLSLRTGLLLYDMMAFKNQHSFFDAGEFSSFVPGILERGLSGGFRFTDAQADDARMVLRLVREAAAEGGTALNYTCAESITRSFTGRVSGAVLRDTETGAAREVSARAVINATGAWAEALHPSPKPRLHLRPLRGSHLVFPGWMLPINQAVTLIHPADSRPLFIIPWQGALVLGTTDLDHGTEIYGEPFISMEEAEYLMQALNEYFPSLGISLSDAVSSWSGIRPVLSRRDKPPSEESRDHIVWKKNGLVTVTGGKLTTFRSLARDAIRAAVKYLPAKPPVKTDKPAFDPPGKKTCPAPSKLSPAACRRLYGRYGGLASDMLENAADRDLDFMPGTRTLWAELPVLAAKEKPRHLSDLLLRRTRAGLLMPGGGEEHLDRIQVLCAPFLDWDEGRWRKERSDYLRIRQQAYSVPSSSKS